MIAWEMRGADGRIGFFASKLEALKVAEPGSIWLPASARPVEVPTAKRALVAFLNALSAKAQGAGA